jgi:hypothetical protein
MDSARLRSRRYFGSYFKGRHFVASALAACISTSAVAADTGKSKGFLVSWFHVAQYYDTEGRDCPKGLNPGPEQYYRRELAAIGKSQAEIDAYIANFLDLSRMGDNAPMVQMRGRIDGKPTDVYAHPYSVPDPNIYVIEGPNGYGFNLDGKDKPGDFYDPDTGEKGVDNQLYRVMGCINEIRPHSPTEYAPLPTSYWSVVQEVMPAMLIEISGIDNEQNDDDVTVAIYRAQERAQSNSNGGLLGGLSFHIDPNPRWHNIMRGKIKDGVITTEPTNLNIATDPFVMPEHKFTQARLRLQIAENGDMKGRLGAYHAWYPYYWMYGVGTWGVEATNNIDLPGFYYALKKNADADPDPKTGENTSISLAYQIDAVPAFIIHDDQTKAGRARGKLARSE